MTLFEIDATEEMLLEELFDPETGVIDEDVKQRLELLEIDKAEKVDGWCYYIKQRTAEIEAAKAVVKVAQDRVKAAENALKATKDCLMELMHGEKHKSVNNTLYYTHNASVVLDEGKTVLDVDDDYLTYSEPTLNKAKIKAALKLGKEIPGVHLEESTSMVIK